MLVNISEKVLFDKELYKNLPKDENGYYNVTRLIMDSANELEKIRRQYALEIRQLKQDLKENIIYAINKTFSEKGE